MKKKYVILIVTLGVLSLFCGCAESQNTSACNIKSNSKMIRNAQVAKIESDVADLPGKERVRLTYNTNPKLSDAMSAVDVFSGKKLIWSKSYDLHSGADCGLYVIKNNGRSCFLEITDEIGQGSGYYHYQVFRLDSEGKMDVISEDSTEFTVTKQNAVTGITKKALTDYAKKLNQKQQDISTGILSFYQDKASYYPGVAVKSEDYSTLCHALDVSAGKTISANLDRVLAEFPMKNGAVDKTQFMANGNLYPLNMTRTSAGKQSIDLDASTVTTGETLELYLPLLDSKDRWKIQSKTNSSVSIDDQENAGLAHFRITTSDETSAIRCSYISNAGTGKKSGFTLLLHCK